MDHQLEQENEQEKGTVNGTRKWNKKMEQEFGTRNGS